MTDKSKSDLLDNLEEVGLSAKEAAVYVDLINRELPTGTTKVVRSTGLHGQFVYDALASLEEKGLVTHVVVGQRKRFSAVHPSHLMYLVDRQKRLVGKVVEELSLKARKNVQQDFTVYLGEEAFVANEFDELDRADEAETWYVIVGESDKFYEIFDSKLLAEFDATRTKKRIQIKCLISTTDRPEFNNIYAPRPSFEIRTLKNFGLSIVNTIVRPHSFALTTYSEKVLTYKLTNDEVALSYRNFFTALWNIAEKV
jgi:sugar-specific transcriptional regulator TrmB